MHAVSKTEKHHGQIAQLSTALEGKPEPVRVMRFKSARRTAHADKN